MRAELSRVPFSEMSINRIVHSAGIPRGSYYQYFTSREDVYDFLFSDLADQAERLCVEALSLCGGDLFAAAPLLFDRAASTMGSDEDLMLLKNFFAQSDPSKSQDRAAHCGAMGAAFVERLRPLIDPKTLEKRALEQLSDVVLMIFVMLRLTLLELSGHGMEAPRARELFISRLELIRRGAQCR